MKIFVAGATGVIGRSLVPLLVATGNEIVGATRHQKQFPQLETAGARPVCVDVLDRTTLLSVLADERPDVVIDELTDLSDRDFAANSRLRIDGTRNLVDAALAAGVERMVAESIAWIYVPGREPADESVPLDLAAPPPRGQTVGAVHTLEQDVAEMPVGISLRYGLLYGPGTWYSREGLITDQVRRGELTATNAINSFIHVTDAARAAVAALAWPTGPVNIVDDEPAAGTEWLPLYAQLVGAPPPPIKSGREGWQRGASNAEARRRGWRPAFPTWREGFKDVLGSEPDNCG